MREFQENYTVGKTAKSIEKTTANLPSDILLWAALGSIAASLIIRILGNKEDALFVGEWAPTFLILGTYNKIVKQHGHD